ncbi:MAG: peptidylprolyl isomerase [Bacteroidia bacterium]
MKKATLFLAYAFSVSLSAFAQAPTNDPTLMTVGGTKVSLSEFSYVYKKNNKDQANDPNALNNYVDLFSVFKMKVKEAEEMKLDTSTSFKNELAGYRRQLAQPYLTDKSVTDSLLREAHGRMKEDIRASHILVRVEENALPKDSLIAWNRMQIIQGLINGKPVTKMIDQYATDVKKQNNITKTSLPADTLKVWQMVNPLRQLDRRYRGKPAPFDEVAKLASQDPSAAENSGDLGYFTAFSMVYPFESLAYRTPVGKVGGPVRTRFGYHVLKVVDRRPAQGEVLVAHIMVKAPTGMPTQDSINAKQKIDEIYTKVKAGEDFATLARQYSDDKPSATKGGEMPWFGTYKMPPVFEKAAFGLQNNGDYTEPIKTAWGWHIIKRIDRRGVPAFDQVKNDLKSRVSRDSRAQQGRASLIARVKRENNFKEDLTARDEFYKLIDSSYFRGQWSAEKAKAMTKQMFSVGNRSYSQVDFAAWLESHQTRRPAVDPKKAINEAYTQFVDEGCIAYEDSQLENKYPEFKNLMQEYRDGILLFDLMDKRVWSKAVKDTTGLRTYYEANKTKYMWNERADATVYSCKDAKTAKLVRKMLKKGKSEKEISDVLNKDSQLNVQFESKVFNKAENSLVDQNWKAGTSADIEKDGRVMIVVTKKIIPPTPKSLQESKGVITSDYQAQLEKEWIESLRKKYPVTVDQAVLKQVK